MKRTMLALVALLAADCTLAVECKSRPTPEPECTEAEKVPRIVGLDCITGGCWMPEVRLECPVTEGEAKQ